MARAGGLRSASRSGGRSGAGSAMPGQLQRSYLTGKVAPRIRWGVPGQFKRCVKQARKHGMGHMAEGACARLYRKANGRWPGRHGGKNGR